MRIQNNLISTYNRQAQTNQMSSKNIGFKSFTRICENGAGKYHDSSFFRDFDTLIAARNIVETFFKENALVISAGCANGEELRSFKATFKSPEKHEFLGIDIAKDPIRLAREKIYSVFARWEDDFLIRPDSELSKQELQCKRLFEKMFVQTEKPPFEINNSKDYKFMSVPRSFKENFFKPRNPNETNVNFLIENLNNINQIDTRGEQASAIFARNMFYHDLENQLELINTFPEKIIKEIDRQEIANNSIEELYKKTKKNGILVMGHNPREHFILADDFTPESNRISIAEFPNFQKRYNNFKRALEAANVSEKNLQEWLNEREQIGQIQFCKTSPLSIALQESGRFKPLHFSNISLDYEYFTQPQTVPLIWQKVK